MNDPTSQRAKMPGTIWALGFVSMLMDISSEMIHSLLPVFTVGALGMSVFALGLIEGAAEATALIVKVFSGVLSDRWRKRKPLALLGYGLGALSKPLFALAGGGGAVLTARLIDRVGKGIRGAPRDALVADVALPENRGAAFGLRQALDTVGAFIGPTLAIALMLAFNDDFRAVFWWAVVPAVAAVLVLALGVREPPASASPASANHGALAAPPPNPLTRVQLARLPRAYWSVVAFGAVFTLARFSEAFLVLRAQQAGLALAWTPLVMIAMNVVYATFAYPFGKLADRLPASRLLAWGLLLLIGADLVLAASAQWWAIAAGVVLWGLHMAMTQGLLAAMVAAHAPADLRGTAYGVFNLASGLALLLASALAGWLWDQIGAGATFSGGAAIAGLALCALLYQRSGSIARQ
jgi:MFS family permease